MLCLILVFLILDVQSAVFSPSSRGKTKNEDQKYWMDFGKEELRVAEELYRKRINTEKARNIILFIGDGMGLPTISATRIFKAQSQGSTRGGEESYLSFDKFPHIGLSKVYNVDAQSPDSAATASALYSGIKTNYYCVGLDNSCKKGSLESHVNESAWVTNIMTWSQLANKSTGFVTTSRVSHATPSSLVAHSALRKWECDKAMPDGASEIGAKDITFQMAKRSPGKKARVILGGGRTTWRPKQKDVNYDGFNCWRTDGLNLIESWMNKSNVLGMENMKGRYVTTKDELLELDYENTDYVLGLFSESHMEYVSAEKDSNSQPSISEMTESALKILQKNPEGFFLMVEGAKIDKGHHEGKANRALMETSAFDDAVLTALNMTSEEDTLIIVTADHGHSISFGAYEQRGVDVRGPSDTMKGVDKKSLPILVYANSPGFNKHYDVDEEKQIIRKEMKDLKYTDPDFLNPAAVQSWESTHSAADVPIYARGPWAHFFHSVHEQSYVAHVMSYGACIGPHADRCDDNGGSNVFKGSLFITLCSSVFSFIYWQI
ncbi:alkaline phosphatase-like [Lepeophtheirus salmonis]|nr:alkaline phosphatase-like [Lepeophtheirus salmonis]